MFVRLRSVRKSTIAIRKLRNNLLAVTLLLTALPPSVQVGSEVVEHACFLVSEIALDTASEVRRNPLRMRSPR